MCCTLGFSQPYAAPFCRVDGELAVGTAANSVPIWYQSLFAVGSTVLMAVAVVPEKLLQLGVSGGTQEREVYLGQKPQFLERGICRSKSAGVPGVLVVGTGGSILH